LRSAIAGGRALDQRFADLCRSKLPDARLLVVTLVEQI